jgi:hypothetical protein
MLNLIDQLFLLSIDEENGTVVPSVVMPLGYGLSGAMLVELVIQGRAKVKDRQRLIVTDLSPFGDELLDEALEQIKESEQPRKLTYWVKHFNAEPKKMRHRMVDRLIAKGVLTQEEMHLSWVVPYGDAPAQSASAKYLLKNRLRSLQLTNQEPELQDLALLSLAKACNVLKLIFTIDERKWARHRIYELMVKQALVNPLVQYIQEIEAAVESQVSAD